MSKKDIIKVEAGINGKVCLFLIPTTPLGSAILKSITDKATIQVVESTAATYFGKTLPIGSVIITEYEKEEIVEESEKDVKNTDSQESK